MELSYRELLERDRKRAEWEATLLTEMTELKTKYAGLLAERNRLFQKVADIMEICSG